MSRNIYNKLLPICSTEYAKRFAVDTKHRETLPDYVRRVRIQEKDLSLSEVQKNSGGQIDGSYVSRIENGLVPNPSPEKLIALAKGLGVPTEEVIAVALGNAVQGEAEFEERKLLNYYRSLPEEQQEYILITAEALVKKFGTKARRGKQLKAQVIGEEVPQERTGKKKKPIPDNSIK